MENVVSKLHALLFSNLVLQSPVLSGSMRSKIQTTAVSDDRCEIMIDAPFYDIKKWEKDKTIVYTGQIINGRTAYAEWVNQSGGFGTHNKSQGWVNRAILEVCTAIANEIGAQVIYDL